MVTGVFNSKSGRGPVRNLPGHVAQLVDIAGKRFAQRRLEAFGGALKHVWSLPHIDPSQIHWVGVNPSSAFELGRARLETTEQDLPMFDFGGVKTAQTVRSGTNHVHLSALLVTEGSEEAGFPVPLAVQGRVPFGESGLADYPIRRQGAIGKEVPTQRVHTLGDLIRESDVWPEAIAWAIPHIPVYRGLAFVPRPTADEESAGGFFPDYSFLIGGERPLLVHRVIEDRYAGAVYNPPPKSGALMFTSQWGLMIQDMRYKGEGEGAEAYEHVYFRAVDAPGLSGGETPELNPVSGRFIFVVMQQMRPEPPKLRGAGDDLRSPDTFLKGADIGATGVGVGRSSGIPVQFGRGVEIDGAVLPTILDIRVLGVNERQEVTPGDIDNVVSLF